MKKNVDKFDLIWNELKSHRKRSEKNDVLCAKVNRKQKKLENDLAQLKHSLMIKSIA